MTNLKIKDIGIFQEIVNNINQVVDIAPQLMKEVNKTLEDLKRDLLTNMNETKNEIKTLDAEIRELGQANQEGGQNDSQVRELRDKLNYLNIRLQDLQNSSSKLDHIINLFKRSENKLIVMLSKMPNAISKLNAIQQISQKYLKINSSGIDSGNNQSTRQNNGNESTIINVLGDTCNVKFKFGKNITEMDLNAIENKLKSSDFKGNKISIDHVSQSDFNVLQKNGFTINKNGPNDFSAFKTIDK
jgi:DNA repair exonuclease SbcCD ATPase subunit